MHRGKPATVALIGLRGSGKSTQGLRLAIALGAEFIDLDDLSPLQIGCATAAEAITTHGLAAFRKAEAVALERVLVQRPGSVLAMGGGSPTAPGAEALIRDAQQRATLSVCYLRASATTLRSRLAGTDLGARPALRDGDPLTEIEAILDERDSLYKSLANQVIECDGPDDEQISAALFEWARAARSPV